MEYTLPKVKTQVGIVHVFPMLGVDSRMYVLIERNEALIVDPNISLDAFKLLSDNGVTDATVLLTHEHFDHISGVNALRDYMNTTVTCSKICGERLGDPRTNLAAYFTLLFIDKDKETQDAAKKLENDKYMCSADITFETELCMKWTEHEIVLKEAPGHSPGGMHIILDGCLAFTGDNLVNGKKTITKLPGGKKKAFFDRTLPLLESMDKEMIICPGHGDCAKMQELEEYLLRRED